MQSVEIVCLGKLGEEYLARGCAEYEKRLSAFCALHITELTPEAIREKDPSPAVVARALDKEADKILGAVPQGSEIVALCVEGEALSSEGLADLVSRNADFGGGKLCFVIGSSYGLHPRVKKAAARRLSFSAMTFPHQLFRLLLLEQLYRAQTIRANIKYHK